MRRASMLQITDVPGIGPSQVMVLFLNLLIIAFIGYLLVYWAHDRKTAISPDDSNKLSVDLRTVTILLALTALVSPVSINIYPHEVYDWMFYLMGMTWMMVGMSFWDIVIDPFILLVGLPFTCLRLLFVYQMHRYLLGRTTRKRTIIVVILSELQLALMTFPVFMILSLIGIPDIVLFIALPVPVLLLVGLVIIRVVPTSQIESPWLSE